MTSGEKSFTKTVRNAKSNFFSSLPVDPNSVEQCQRSHHHQRVPKGWTEAGFTPDAEAPPRCANP